MSENRTTQDNLLTLLETGQFSRFELEPELVVIFSVVAFRPSTLQDHTYVVARNTDGPQDFDITTPFQMPDIIQEDR